ncbi:MAG: sulfite exporter TauE/SafE family protein [bacterium]
MSALIEGFTLGISTGPYCFAACAPLLLPYILSEGRQSWKQNFFILFQFLAGRFVAYLIFAVAASMAGIMARPSLPPWVAPAAMTVTALIMLAYALASGLPKLSLCPAALQSSIFQRIPFLTGFLTGINVCPPFVAGFLRLVQLASITKGLLFFAAFFAATSVYVLPFAATTPWLNARLRPIGRMALALAGVWYLFSGIKSLSGF